MYVFIGIHAIQLHKPNLLTVSTYFIPKKALTLPAENNQINKNYKIFKL